MKYSLLIISLLSCFALVGQSDLEEALFALPDVVFKSIEAPDGYASAYELKIRQPLDHKNPEKGHFYQRAFLSHKSFDAPTAIITNGYGRPRNYITEVAKIASANQIQVEHRYFLESCPDSMDYTYLNFEQVTADLHHINELFRNIYSGKWISTGISKGGTTTIFYRYFYPDDVDVSIPYVAPVNLSDEDDRIYQFLDTVGTEACRTSLFDYQREMLARAEEMKSFLKWYAKGEGLAFNYLTLDEAYEYAVLEYPFSFWQWGSDCTKVPAPSAPRDTLLQHFIDVVGLSFYADESMEAFGSHYFQSAEEMGYYGFEIDDFDGLIKYLDTASNPSAIFTPDKLDVPFKGMLTQKVYMWTQNNDEEFVYINGAKDTWSATAVPEVKDDASLWFFLKDKAHADARIKNMTDNEKKLLKAKLEKWLEEDIDLSVLENK